MTGLKRWLGIFFFNLIGQELALHNDRIIRQHLQNYYREQDEWRQDARKTQIEMSDSIRSFARDQRESRNDHSEFMDRLDKIISLLEAKI